MNVEDNGFANDRIMEILKTYEGITKTGWLKLGYYGDG